MPAGRRRRPIVTQFAVLVADDLSSGGIYQYSRALNEALSHLAADERIPLPIVVTRSDAHQIQASLLVSLDPAPRGFFKDLARRWLPEVAKESLRRTFRRCTGAADRPIRHRRDVNRRLKGHGIDVLILPAPDSLAFQAGVPSIMAVHDLQHQLQPEFPEVSQKGEWEAREYIYRNAAREALFLLVDSEIGKEDVLEFYSEYGATPERIKVLPFVPSPDLRSDLTTNEVRDAMSRFDLPERFFLYPAQFWPHKNHMRLIEALGSLREKDAHLVLCGSNSGSLRKRTFKEAMRRAVELHLEDRVHYLGYVTDEELSALYASAVGLVFPTFFGPTNIPVIEAWNFDLPVMTSRIRGITEQVGDAGLLIDPRSVEEIADAMRRLWSDAELASSLAEAGRRQLSLYTPEDHRERLAEILDEAEARLGR